MAIDYSKKTWGYGDDVLPDDLNRFENGINDAVNGVNNLEQAISGNIVAKQISIGQLTIEAGGLSVNQNVDVAFDGFTAIAPVSYVFNDSIQAKMLQMKPNGTNKIDVVVANPTNAQIVCRLDVIVLYSKNIQQ